jgi:methylphosphotriester-DNA--protein-cysteine methyltransferase
VADNLQQRGGQDRTRIDISQDHERRSWSEKFGVTPEQLAEAVRIAGTNASAVENYLKRNGIASAGS